MKTPYALNEAVQNGPCCGTGYLKTSRAKGLAVTVKQAKPPPVALGKQYVIKYNLLTVFARNTVSKEVGLRVSNV